MAGFGELKRGAVAVLVFRLAITNAAEQEESRWCPENAAPTANAYNCAGRVGMVCPSRTEVEEWGVAVAQAWAGYEMVTCTETGAFARPGGVPKVVRRCDGTNDCIAEGGSCRIDENGTPICSTDELGCGGLVDQVIGGTLIEQPPPVTVDNPPMALSMGRSINLMVGSSLQSNWIVPYNDLIPWGDVGSYSYATCATYSEIADTQPSIQMDILPGDVTYTPAADADLATFDDFEWPEGTVRVTPERCDDFDTCTKVDTNAACCVAPSTCCGSYTIQEDDGVTLEFTPPNNFVGTAEFTMTLRTPDGSPETATIQRTITATVAVPECMLDASAPRSPESFCGVNGICTGPSGCECDPRWYGIQCDNQSEELLAPEFVWRGWTALFITVILAAGCCGFVWFANNTDKGKEMFGATLDEITGTLQPPEIPDIPSRNVGQLPENEPPATKGVP